MIALAAGLLLGISGSVHCAAMCGPLVAAAENAAARERGIPFGRGQALYHGGRIGMYALLGAAAGASGAAIADRGFGRGLAVAAGLALLVQACIAAGAVPGGIGTAASSRLVAVLSRAAGRLRRHGLARPPVMGALNGLLPCGLVYAAVIAASGTGGVPAALSLMLGFGLGTLPALLGVGVVSGVTAARVVPGVRRVAVPAVLAVAGVVLIARGLGPASQHEHAGLAAAAATVPAPSTASGHAHH
jgi:sulfite exporter TauE/SafE